MLIIIAVVLFGFIIFVHEFGHFFTAKIMGVRVNEFALGMGPTVFKFQKGETKYSLRAFPIGGFCAMEGEDTDSGEESAFGNKAVWKRVIIVTAGAIMNIILGLVLMIVLTGQQHYFASTTIAGFMENSVSNQYGLAVGDKIVSVNGYNIMTDRDLTFAFSVGAGSNFDIGVERNGEKVIINDVEFLSSETEDGHKVISLDFYVNPINKNLWTLLSQSFMKTVSTVRMVWASLVGLVMGRFGFNDLAGPVGAASAISQAASVGLKVNFLQAVNNIIMMMIFLTVNLGIVNLLPLPALDGGRLVFLIVEGIRKKPVPAKYEGWIHAAGFALLIAFMLVITYSDILRLFTGEGLGA